MEAAVRRMERGETEEDVIAEFENVFSLLVTPAPLLLNPVQTSVDIRPIVQTFEGVLLGFGETVSVNFATCVQDGQVDMQNFKKALDLIETKNVKNVYEGVKELGQIAQALPKAIEDCKGSKDDFKKLLDATQLVKHPLSFAYHVGKDIYVNHVDIFKHIEEMIQAFNEKKYVAFGKELGIVLELVLVGKEEQAKLLKNSIQDVEHVFEGMLIGFGKNVSVNFTNCIHDGKTDMKEFIKGVKLIETNKPKKVLKGLKLIAKAGKGLPTAIKECKGAEEDFKDLLKALESMHNPTQFAFHVGKDLFLNRK